MRFGLRSGQARSGLIIVAIVVVGALVAPWLLPWDPSVQDLPNRLQGPTWQHWFGPDERGRDILARVLLGARVSLVVGIIVVRVPSIVGMGAVGVPAYDDARREEGSRGRLAAVMAVH